MDVRYGWFSVGLDDGSGFCVKKHEKFEDVVKFYPNACLILVDMPIGTMRFRVICTGEPVIWKPIKQDGVA